MRRKCETWSCEKERLPPVTTLLFIIIIQNNKILKRQFRESVDGCHADL